MTQIQQWMMCLALVYGVPSFLFGIGVTLLFVRWRDRRGANAKPAHKVDPLALDFRLPQLFDDERLIGL
jgi:hypothetical protein